MTKETKSAFNEANINTLAYVKLNAYGVNILRELHVYQNGVKGPAFDIRQAAPADEAGFSKWRLWELMLVFGGCMGTGLAAPWDGNIFLSKEAE